MVTHFESGLFFSFQIDKEGENKVSVQDILLELRRYRMGLIQTFDQLYFSYQAIIEGMKRMNNSVRLSLSVFVPKTSTCNRSFFPCSLSRTLKS